MMNQLSAAADELCSHLAMRLYGFQGLTPFFSTSALTFCIPKRLVPTLYHANDKLRFYSDNQTRIEIGKFIDGF